VSSPNRSNPAQVLSRPAPGMMPASGVARASVMVGTGLACFLAQWVSVMLWVPPAQVTPIWLAGGLMLAIALVSEPRQWPAVIGAGAAGQALLFLILELVPPPTAVLLGLLSGLNTVAVAAVLRAELRGALVLATLREFLVYLIVVLVGGAGLASMLFIAGAWGLRFRPVTFVVWRTFALSAVLGYLTITPMVVRLVQDAELFRRDSLRHRLEAGVLVILLVLVSGLVFAGDAHRSVIWPVSALTLPPLLLWSAVRFGTLGVSASLLLVTVISTLRTAQGLGPFTSQSPGANTLSLQLFILGIGLPLLGLAVVLDEQKRTTTALQSAELRLRGLNRDLMAAREEEGSRIARELHDDVGQRLALVAIGLSRLKRSLAEAAPGPVRDIAQLQEQTGSIVHSVRELSHQLHPAALEHVGLATAIQMKCEEVQHATGLQVRMTSHGDTSDLPREISLCLFRAAQEALNNVIRHSGARSTELSLRRAGTELFLQVTDDGRGFTPTKPDQRTGLGLYSLSERIGLVGGTMTVISAPGRGTTVRLVVPLQETRNA
jgi:signal transduction histidine kinase